MISVTLQYVRGTKGLCRYEEVISEGQQALLGALYVAKERLGGKPPKQIMLSITTQGGLDAAS